MGEKTIFDVVHRTEDLDNLSIISSGPIPPNPAELLGSKKMKNFLDKIRDEYDMIILDTPPVGLVTDSAVLSTLADGLIQVVAVSQTDIEMVKRAKELLDNVNANIIGVVLNKVPTEGRFYYKYHYYQYYDYYGEDSNKLKKRRSKS